MLNQLNSISWAKLHKNHIQKSLKEIIYKSYQRSQNCRLLESQNVDISLL